MANRDKPIALIVDDVSENLKILMDMLQDNYHIKAAKNGEKALQHALSDPIPDVILLDIMMPGMDGFEVCLKLKSNPRTWSIPVLFITAMDQQADEERGLTVGAVDYITKPFQPPLVKARVRSQIELKQHKDRLEELVQERTRQLMETQDVTIMTLASLAEARDPETGGHIKRTQNYVSLLAEALTNKPEFRDSLTPESKDLLRKSAPLHDVGKVGVPDHILLKPGKLTFQEFEIMKRHTIIGAEALEKAAAQSNFGGFLRMGALIARSHHEKFDGSGYPDRIEADDIPLCARITAVADVFDALTSARVYKDPMPAEDARDVIVSQSGKHFDPAIIDAFLAKFDDFLRVKDSIDGGEVDPSTPVICFSETLSLFETAALTS